MKVLVYKDLTQYFSCSSELFDWKSYVEKFRKMDVPVYFVLNIDSKRKKRLSDLLSQWELGYNIMIDTSSLFFEGNQLEVSTTFHTFLLDNRNRAVVLGSPFYNEEMLDLYKLALSSK